MAAEHEDHGNTIAAWTTVTTLIIASVVMGAAVLISNIPLFIGSIALGVVGVIAGKVLSMAGFGKERDVAEVADAA